MIFDDEKAAAARRAINHVIADRTEKRQRILRHLSAVSGVKQYGLPYRVLFRYVPEPFEIELNPYYPEPAEPITGGEPKHYDCEDPEQVRQWERLFTRFVVPYEAELEDWGPFDWFGDTQHTTEDAERQRRRFKLLLSEYHANPERFETKAPQKKVEHYKQYRVIPGYMVGLYGPETLEAKQVEQAELRMILKAR